MNDRNEIEYLKAQVDYWRNYAEELVKKLCERETLVPAPVYFKMDIDPRIDRIKEAVLGYYDCLSQRRHAGVAVALAFDEIEKILGLSFDTYQAGVQL